jgi:hypothetical protein
MARLALALVMTLTALACTSAAFAEDLLPGRQPWKWQDSNRASIAAMIEQRHGRLGGSGSGGSGGANLCGGSGGTTSAIQNYTCIIVNGGSTENLDATQGAAGGSSSTTTTNATANGVPNNQLSSVLQALVP